MPQFENTRVMSKGQFWARIYSEDQAKSWNLGCLERVGFRFGKDIFTRVCDVRDGPISISSINPQCNVFMDQKELAVDNFLTSLCDASYTGAALTAQRLVGPGNGVASTTTAPAEWHIVNIGGASGPFTFSLFAENRDLEEGTADWDVYTCAYTNGDTSVAAFTPGSGGSIALSDNRLGKFTFTTIPDSDLSQWVYDDADAKFTVNGKYPFIEKDVKTGDTVALIGLTYSWGKASYTGGTDVAAGERQLIYTSTNQVEPVSIKLVHAMEDNRDRKALVMYFWKCIPEGSVDFAVNPTALADFTLPVSFRVLNDKENHPDSPFFAVEYMATTSDIDFEVLV